MDSGWHVEDFLGKEICVIHSSVVITEVLHQLV